MQKYITKEEYKAAKGVDLDIELLEDDDSTNKADRFIRQWTDWCADYLISEYRASILEEWPISGEPCPRLLTEERQRLFREGCIEQMEYILSNGDVTKSSGINREIGTVSDYKGVELCRAAARKFRLAGFMNI